MRVPNLLTAGSRLSFAVAFAALLVLPACSMNVKKDGEEGDKKVDIVTPVGSLHVSKGADVRDVGLPVYPGARPKQKAEDGEEKSANVNISSGFFGLKVVAIEYESDDPPEKIISYYKEQLKKYGNVLECHTSKDTSNQFDIHEGKDDSDSDSDDHGSKALKCSGDNAGKNVELKVGTEGNQHLVSIKPEGKGTDFGLAYVRTHGKDTI
jgi:hypothetical protein